MGFVDDLKAAVGFGETVKDEPNWKKRLYEPKYTSPTGKTLSFQYEDVSVRGRNKTAAFDFAGANGTYIQHNGKGSRRYPLRIFFEGGDYDQVADSFEDMIGETGVGKLLHPRYGLMDVVPFRDWVRTDRLKNGANQAVFDVMFFKTINIIYPTAGIDPQAETLAAIAAFNLASAAQFADQMDLDSALENASALDKFNALVKKAGNVLRVISDKQADVKNKFDDVEDSINGALDVLIGDPLTLAFQTKQLLGAPARALTDIRARLDAYKNLAGDIFSGPDSVAEPVFDGPGSPGSPGFGPGNDSQSPNAFHLNNLFVTGSVVGQILSSVNNEFETNTAAIEAAEEILDLADQTTAWQDENYQSIGGSTFSTPSNTDTGDGYQQLQKAVALVTGFLLEISFSLKQEKVIVLSRPRTIIDLCGELYQDVSDETLNTMIITNNLVGGEFFELPRGKSIVYYV